MDERIRIERSRFNVPSLSRESSKQSPGNYARR